VVEEAADAAAGSLDDLAGAFGCAYTRVFRSHAHTFADVANAFDGVEGNDVGRSFASAFGDVAGGSACTFADVPGTAAYVTASATRLSLRGGRGGLLLLRVGADSDEGYGSKDGEGEKDAVNSGAHKAKPPGNWMQLGARRLREERARGGRN